MRTCGHSAQCCLKRLPVGDGGRCSVRGGSRIHSSPQELIGSTWSGESVSEVPPASIQAEVALASMHRDATREARQGIGAAPIHANPFHVLAEATP